MATEEQIDNAVAKAEAYANAKQAFETAQASLARAQAIVDTANGLIEALASDGADPGQWEALIGGLGETQSVKATRVSAWSAAYAAMNNAKSELDTAIAALSS